MKTSGDQRGPNFGSNVLTTVVGNAFPPLAAFATAPILAQVLGAADRGVVASATAPLLLATAAATLGTPEAVTHFIARSFAFKTYVKSAIVLLMLVAGAMATGLVLLYANALSGGVPSTADVISLAALAITPTLFVAVIRGLAGGQHAWKLVAAERFATSFLRLIGIVVLALSSSLTVYSAVIVLATTPIAGGAVYLALLFRSQATPDGQSAVSVGSGRVIAYGLRIWIGSISGILLSRLDQTLMTGLAGVTALGLYVVAVNISEVALVANSAVRDVTLASESRRSDPAKLIQAGRLSGLVSILIAVSVGATLPFWLVPLFGPEFEAAIWPAEILLLAVAVGTPGSVAGAGLSAWGKPELRSASLVLACVVNLCVLFVLVPSLGALGAALATLLGNVVASNANLVWLKLKFGVDPWQFYRFKVSDVVLLYQFARGLIRRGNRS